MKKRLLAAILWFYAAWYAGAMLAALLGVSPILGLITGISAGALIAGDPLRVIWTRTTASRSEPTAGVALR